MKTLKRILAGFGFWILAIHYLVFVWPRIAAQYDRAERLES